MEAIDALLKAQIELSPKLVGAKHAWLIRAAENYGGKSSVPGAGGEGGSVISVFPDEDQLELYAQWVLANHPEVRLFRASYPGLN